MRPKLQMIVGSALLVLLPIIALAYSVNPGTAATPPPAPAPAAPNAMSGSSMGDLLSPITNFMNSLHFGGTTVNFGSMSIPSVVQNPQNFMRSMDGWFTQNTGFSLWEVLHAILTFISWILDLAKKVVDWLLSFVH